MIELIWDKKQQTRTYNYDTSACLTHIFNVGNSSYVTPDINMSAVIHGDNIVSMQALLDTHQGRIDIVYLDPPYNTGNTNWSYNDNITTEEDECRHSAWLNMMYKVLTQSRKLMSDDSTIFVSIDTNEIAGLKLIMDEIFGSNNFIELFSWCRTNTPSNLSNKSRKTVEYILCYEKRKTNRKYVSESSEFCSAPLLNSGQKHSTISIQHDSIVLNLPDGTYERGQYGNVYIQQPVTVVNRQLTSDLICTGPFKWSQNKIDDEISKGTYFTVNTNKFSIRYQRVGKVHKSPTNRLKYYHDTTLDSSLNIGTNESSKKEVFNIFNSHVFDYPKPTSLIEYLIKLTNIDNPTVLDCFGGSGTTGHAIINMNKVDNGQRKFIILEKEDYALTTTAERIRRVLHDNNLFDLYGFSCFVS